MEERPADVVQIEDRRHGAQGPLRREIARIARGDASFMAAVRETATVTVVGPERSGGGQPDSVFTTVASLSDAAVDAIRRAASRSALERPFHVSVAIDP